MAATHRPFRIGMGWAKYWNRVPPMVVWEYQYRFLRTLAHAEKIPRVRRVKHKFTIQIPKYSCAEPLNLSLNSGDCACIDWSILTDFVISGEGSSAALLACRDFSVSTQLPVIQIFFPSSFPWVLFSAWNEKPNDNKSSMRESFDLNELINSSEDFSAKDSTPESSCSVKLFIFSMVSYPALIIFSHLL